MTEDPKLTEALLNFYVAFNDRDLERLVALFEPQAVYVTGSGQCARNRTEIRAALQRALDLDIRIIQGTRETIIAGDIALMMSNWSQASSGGDEEPRSGTSNIVFRRQPAGNWLIVIDNPMGAALIISP